jgi:hypothetical protein
MALLLNLCFPVKSKIQFILLILARPTFGPNPFVSSFISKICQFPNKFDILSFVSSLHSLPSKNVQRGADTVGHDVPVVTARTRKSPLTLLPSYSLLDEGGSTLQRPTAPVRFYPTKN